MKLQTLNLIRKKFFPSFKNPLLFLNKLYLYREELKSSLFFSVSLR